MKFILSIIALCAIQNTYAQKIIKESYDSDQIEEIKIDSKYADIEIETYDGNEIIVEASVNINLNMDNENYSFETLISGNSITILSKIDFSDIPKRVIVKDHEGNTKILLTDDESLDYINSDENNYKNINYGYQTDITLKVKVPNNKDVFVESIYGGLIATGSYKNIVVNITYGDIEIKRSNVSPSSTLTLKSTYGHVDYSVPHTSHIEFNLSTSYGEIFTDLDVVSSNKNVFDRKSCGTQKGGKFTLNEGTSIAYITATYDDIYIRKN